MENIINDNTQPGKEFSRVLSGKGYGVVEDCGGIWGLADLVEAFTKKEGEEYED